MQRACTLPGFVVARTPEASRGCRAQEFELSKVCTACDPQSIGSCLGWTRPAFLFLMLAFALGARAQAPEDVSVLRAWFNDETQLRAVSHLLGHAQIDREKGLLRTEADHALRVQLAAAGFRLETDIDATLSLRRLLAAERSGLKSIPGFACYRTVEETQTSMQALVNAYPDLVEIVDIGPTWQALDGVGGYTLKVLRATQRGIAGPKPKLFMMTSVHAREYTPAELGTRFVEELLAGYGSDPEATWLLDHHELHALLQANPDGRKRAETGVLWRKNHNTTHCGAGNSAGVDLNRNFPFEWGNWNGSSGTACNDTFRGPFPASEPETQAVIDYVRSRFEDTRDTPLAAPADPDTQGIFLDIHSYSGLVLWPWGFTSTLAPNATALQALGRRLAWFNNYTPQASVGLYPTDGTTDDFAYGELGLPAYTFELGTAFFQDCASFENTILPNNRNALRYALRAARAPYRQPAGPDAYGLRVEPDLVSPGDSVRVVATLDDVRQREGSFTASGPQPPVQAIASARAYLGAIPWEAGATGMPMQASDGAFNASVEQAQVDLPTAGLSIGRHLVYVQGRDAAGNDGPPAAVFIDLVDPAGLIVLEGSVRQAGTLLPLQAEVRAGGYQATSHPATGAYRRPLPAGSYQVAVSASGHETLTVANVSGQGGETLVRDFQLFALCPLLEDPVELSLPTPFTAQSPWTRRASAGVGGGSAWLQSASGNYGNNLNTSLSSAVIDLSGYSAPVLAFDQRCDTEATYDFGRVEISTTGGATWIEVFRCDGEASWRRVELDLPQLAGAANARIRFRFTSDSSQNRSGWAIDNILLQAGGPTCRESQGPQPLQLDGFSATPSTLYAGSATVLTWHTRGAAACRISNSLDGNEILLAPGELAAGQRSLVPTASLTYTLHCIGLDKDETASLQTPVSVLPRLQPFRNGFEAIVR